MIITMVARRRRQLNSDVIAIAFGIAPPRRAVKPDRKQRVDVLDKRGDQRADTERKRSK
jgi:hypothetical protein